jgi:hypothetical protein
MVHCSDRYSLFETCGGGESLGKLDEMCEEVAGKIQSDTKSLIRPFNFN